MRFKGRKKLIFFLVLTSLVLSLCALYFLSKIERVKTSQTSPTDNNADLKKLSSLGYVTWTPVATEDLEKSGVIKYDTKMACKGINLYYSENKKGGHFFDMAGNILHAFSDKRFWPDKKFWRKSKWQFIEPYNDNEFLVIIQKKEIFRIDWNSKVIKRITGPFHHDVAVADDGGVYALMHEKIDFPEFSTTEPIRDDWLVLLTKDGKIEKKASFANMVLKNKTLYDVVRNTKERKYHFGKDAWDVFHTNSVEIINRDVFFGDKKLFKKGDILCCIRHFNAIVVIDVETKEFIWHWGMDELDLPHHASLLENGNILLFDNGTSRKYSRVLEVNPGTKEIEWEYKAPNPESFFSETRGSAQRLPNGNTLITESHKGRVFEVTPEKEIVWEFYNPEIQTVRDKKTGKKEKKRATIYRMSRVFDWKKYPQLRKTN